jgi:hypothetical protein
VKKEYIPLTAKSLREYLGVKDNCPLTIKDMGHLVGLTVCENPNDPQEGRVWAIGNISVDNGNTFIIESVPGSSTIVNTTFCEVRVYLDDSRPSDALLLIEKSK